VSPAFFDRPDALGRRVVLPDRPQRIVSLVPSITDLLHALDLGDQVAGVTRFCERPEHWRDTKTVVGGTKDVKANVIAELGADLVLANLEENEKADVDAMIDASDAPVYVTDVETVPDATDMIRTVGALTGTAEAAQDMADTIDARFQDFEPPSTLRAAYLIWRDPYMSVGSDTFIHDVMRRGGFENVFSGDTRYPTVTLDEIAAREPDVVLCSSEPFPFHQKERFTEEIRDALLNTRVDIMDGQLFSWYGPRLLETPAYLRELQDTLRSSLSGTRA
jgi:ABC-type Fe3+-hydroxamate transport system substrate-binding protein